MTPGFPLRANSTSSGNVNDLADASGAPAATHAAKAAIPITVLRDIGHLTNTAGAGLPIQFSEPGSPTESVGDLKADLG
jgi:hypothetical protein